MKGEQELRCYTFTLYQLSSIQQGIQAGHAAVELMLKYPRVPTDIYYGLNSVYEWAHYWKTMVLLNGGDLSELRDLILFFSSVSNPYRWVPFYESEDSLDGIPTSIAIVLPERIFKAAEFLRKCQELPSADEYSVWELDLISRLAAAGLAR